MHPNAAVTLHLQAEQHFRIPAGSRWCVHCRAGLLWITSGSQLHDWTLREGESLEVAGPDVLIGCLGESVVSISPAPEVPGRHEAPQPGPMPRWRALAALFARRVYRLPPGLT